MARSEDHLAALLELPPGERARAANVLLDSLDEGEADPEAARAKVAELTRRARAVAAGTATLIDGAEARARVEARLRAVRAVSRPDLIEASKEVDRSLLQWSLSLTPRQRLEACTRATRALSRFKRVRPPENR